ncbi:MAG: molybdopterin molybdotransferase MoeA [Flavobacteriales bacterium]
MIPVSEAKHIILEQTRSFGTTRVDFKDALGKILAEDLLADQDFPPFNRVMMDGIAIRFRDLETHKTFNKIGIVGAGEMCSVIPNAGDCIEIMTGAKLPESFDTVVPYEDVDFIGNHFSIKKYPSKAGQNVHTKGLDARKGDVLVPKGRIVNESIIGVMASIGKTNVEVLISPRILILSVGNELIEIDQTPNEVEIRKSNIYALQSLCIAMGIQAEMMHLPDDRNVIHQAFQDIKHYDVLLLSGGVSKGLFDFVPSELEAAGFNKTFHKVEQKPGKPFWFGTKEHQVVFAFPGNPVSTLVCAKYYFVAWLRKSLGLEQNSSFVKLAVDFEKKGSLTNFLGVKIKNENGILFAYPNAGNGSGDFASLVHIDGWVVLPAGQNHFEAGCLLEFVPC